MGAKGGREGGGRVGGVCGGMRARQPATAASAAPPATRAQLQIDAHQARDVAPSTYEDDEDDTSTKSSKCMLTYIHTYQQISLCDCVYVCVDMCMYGRMQVGVYVSTCDWVLVCRYASA